MYVSEAEPVICCQSSYRIERLDSSTPGSRWQAIRNIHAAADASGGSANLTGLSFRRRILLALFGQQLPLNGRVSLSGVNDELLIISYCLLC